MSHHAAIKNVHRRDLRRTIIRMLHKPLLWLGIVVVLAVPLFFLGSNLIAKGTNSPHGTNSAPADLFMQSVVTRDVNLGWHQLCPALQAQVPLGALANQVQQQRIAEVKEGLTMTLDFVGSHPRPQGGQIRVYVVVAHRPNGWVAQRTYILSTQASGCVDDINTS
jgi:hypothetical protein